MFRSIAIVFATVMVSVAAQAYGGGACKGDIEKFCAGIEKGEGRIMKCLHDKRDQISEECKAQAEKMKEAMSDIREACQEDVVKFCSEVKPGKARIMNCMKEHKADLSDGCKAVMETKKKKK
jgi:hypothetical protein